MPTPYSPLRDDPRYRYGYRGGLTTKQAFDILGGGKQTQARKTQTRDDRVKAAKKAGVFDSIRDNFNATQPAHIMDEKGVIQPYTGIESDIKYSTAGERRVTAFEAANRKNEERLAALRAKAEQERLKAEKKALADSAEIMALEEQAAYDAKKLKFKSSEDWLVDQHRSTTAKSAALRVKTNTARQDLDRLLADARRAEKDGLEAPKGLAETQKAYEAARALSDESDIKVAKSAQELDDWRRLNRSDIEANEAFGTGIKERRAKREAGMKIGSLTVPKPEPQDKGQSRAGGRTVENPVSAKGLMAVEAMRDFAQTIPDSNIYAEINRDIEARETDPLAWEQAQLQSIASTPPEKLAAQIENWSMIRQRQQERMNDIMEAARLKREDFAAKVKELQDSNARILTGETFTMADRVKDDDGSVWARALLADKARLKVEQDRHEEDLREQVMRDQQEMERDVRIHDARVKFLQELGAKEAAKAKSEQDRQFNELRATGLSSVADSLAESRKSFDERQRVLDEIYPDRGPEHEAGSKALMDERQQASRAASAQALEVSSKARDLHDQWGSNLDYDWTDPKSYGEVEQRLEQEARKRGLSAKDARYWLTTYRQLDWTRPSPIKVGGREVKGDVRFLPNGNVSVSPELILDRQGYEAALKGSGATDEAIKRAMEAREEAAPKVAEAAWEIVRADEQTRDWVARNLPKDATPQAIMEAVVADSRKSGAGYAALKKFTAGLNQIGLSWTGLADMISGRGPGSDTNLLNSAYWKRQSEADSYIAEAAKKASGPVAKFLADTAGIAPSVAEAIVAGGATRGVAKYFLLPKGAKGARTFAKVAEGLGVAGSAVDAGIQSLGSTYVDAYNEAIKDEFGKLGFDLDGRPPTKAEIESARQVARNTALKPALLSGLATSVITALGGAGGIESVFRAKAHKTLADKIKGVLLKKQAKIVQEGGQEFLEEYSDQLAQGWIAQTTYNPDLSPAEAFDQSLYAGALGSVAGGGTTAVSELRGWKDTPEAKAATQESLARQLKAITDPAVKSHVDAVTAVLTGTKLADLTTEQLRSLGLKRDSKGAIKPISGKITPGAYEQDGEVVLTDAAIKAATDAVPAILDIAPLSEQGRLAQIRESKQESPDRKSVGQNAAAEPRGADEDESADEETSPEGSIPSPESVTTEQLQGLSSVGLKAMAEQADNKARAAAQMAQSGQQQDREAYQQAKAAQERVDAEVARREAGGKRVVTRPPTLEQQLRQARAEADAEKAKWGTKDFDVNRNGAAIAKVEALEAQVRKANHDAMVKAGRSVVDQKAHEAATASPTRKTRPASAVRQKLLRKAMSGEELTPEEQETKKAELEWVAETQKLPADSLELKDDETFKTWKSARNNVSAEHGVIVKDQSGLDQISELHQALLNRGESDKAADLRRAVENTRPAEEDAAKIIQKAKDAGLEMTQEEADRLAEDGKATNARIASLKAKMASASPTVDSKAHQAATSPTNDLAEPTEAQKKAGNYKMGHLNVGGVAISIENPHGSTRKWTNAAGESGESEVHGHYGYLRNTTGADGDHIDVFVRNGTPEDWNGEVYVIHQMTPDGQDFDEHKVMIGYSSAKEAKKAYKRNYQKGWKGYGGYQVMTMKALAEAVRSGTLKKAPKPAPTTTPSNESAPETPVTPGSQASTPPEPLAPKAAGPEEDQRRHEGRHGGGVQSPQGLGNWTARTKSGKVVTTPAQQDDTEEAALKRLALAAPDRDPVVPSSIIAPQAGQESTPDVKSGYGIPSDSYEVPKADMTNPQALADHIRAPIEAMIQNSPPEQHRTLREIASAIVQNLLPYLKNGNFKRLMISPGHHDESSVGGGFSVTQDGTVIVMPAHFAQTVMSNALMAGDSFSEVAGDLVEIGPLHEAIHQVLDNTITNEQAAEIWRSLPAGVQARFRQAYTYGRNTDHSDSYMGHEFMRSRLEAVLTGKTSEQVFGKALSFGTLVQRKIAELIEALAKALRFMHLKMDKDSRERYKAVLDKAIENMRVSLPAEVVEMFAERARQEGREAVEPKSKRGDVRQMSAPFLSPYDDADTAKLYFPENTTTSEAGGQQGGRGVRAEPGGGSIPPVIMDGSIAKKPDQSSDDTRAMSAPSPNVQASPVVYRGHTSGSVTNREKDLTNPGNIIFSSNENVAKHYARTRPNGVVTSAVLHYSNPLIIDANNESYAGVPVPPELAEQFVRPVAQIDYLATRAKEAGYDALIVKNVTDQWGDGDQYVVFDESQIKPPKAMAMSAPSTANRQPAGLSALFPRVGSDTPQGPAPDPARIEAARQSAKADSGGDLGQLFTTEARMSQPGGSLEVRGTDAKTVPQAMALISMGADPRRIAAMWSHHRNQFSRGLTKAPSPFTPEELLRFALAAEARKGSTQFVSLKAAHDQMLGAEPWLSTPQFLERVSQAYEAGRVMLEPPNDQSDFAQAGDHVIRDSLGAPGVRLAWAPQSLDGDVRQMSAPEAMQALYGKELDQNPPFDKIHSHEDQKDKPDHPQLRGVRGIVMGDSPLPGAPSIKGATGPDPRIVQVAENYARSQGFELKRQSEYVEVDQDRAERIAAAYEAMPHAPQDPKVRDAYENLIRQTRAQYDALVKAGYRFWFIDPDNNPYGPPWDAMRDLRANQSMGVFPTTAGFGSGDAISGNPLEAETGLQWHYGSESGPLRPVLANDLFRAVHDAFGHGLEGAGFRARGEENAWQAHVRLFTGSAIAAITTETRGQNSWLNFGPYGEQNQTAKVEDTHFADQKTGLMPEWTWTEGRAGDQDVRQMSAPSSVTPEQDAEYMAAVESGDLKKAQNMVDEAAKAAGYTVGPVWHGTPNDWTVYDLQKSGATDAGYLGKGIYLGPSQRWGDVYAKGGNVLKLFASINNPLQVEAEFDGKREIDRNITVKKALGLSRDSSPSEVTKRASSLGYDGIQYSYKGEVETVVFNPNQIKSADPVTYDEQGNVIPLSRRFDDQSNDIRFMSAPGRDPAPFYSKLERFLEGKMPNRADPKAVAAMISNPQSGIKAEEIKWTGIRPWLESQTGPVTKQAVLDYLAGDGAVRLEEVRMGDRSGYLEKEYQDAKEADKRILQQFGFAQRSKLNGALASEDPAIRERAEEAADAAKTTYDEMLRIAGLQAKAERESKPKFSQSQYQLPGGENYREVVLAMPPKAPKGWTATRLNSPDAGFNHWQINDADGNPVTDIVGGPAESAINKAAEGDTYTSSHFPDVPNYVAHLRLNDREDAEGRPGVFIEEFQNDRANEWVAARDQWVKDNHPGIKFEKLDKAGQEKAREYARAKVPVGPFTENQGAWIVHLFKRALAEAVAQGKAWIGWTTGEAQADRYDLSKHITTLRYEDTDTGNYNLFAEKDGNTVIEENDIRRDKLPDYVGKEIAQKIIDGEGADDGEGGTYLTGLDLRVGGEDKLTTYNRVAVNEIGKYVKQWGAGVVKTNIVTDNRMIVQGRRQGGEWDNSGTANPMQANVALNTRRAQFPDLEWRIVPAAEPTPIWRVDITPAMRADIESRGQPRFMSAPSRGQDQDPDSAILRRLARALPTDDEMSQLDKSARKVARGVGKRGQVVAEWTRSFNTQPDTVKGWERAARQMIRENRQGVIDQIVNNFYDGMDFASPELAMAGSMLLPELFRDAHASRDPAAIRKAYAFAYAHGAGATQTGRTLRALNNPHRLHADHVREMISKLTTTLTPKVRAQIAAAPTPMEKQRQIDELTRKLRDAEKRTAQTTPGTQEAQKAAEASASLRRGLKAARDTESKEDLIAKFTEEKRNAIAEALKREGLTEDDIFIGAQDRLDAQESQLVQDAIAQHPEVQHEAIRHIMSGRYSHADIAKMTGMPVGAIAALHDRFRNQTLRRSVTGWVRQGRSFLDMVKAGVQRMLGIKGDGDTRQMAAPKGYTLAQVEAAINPGLAAEIDRQLAILCPTAAQVNGKNTLVAELVRSKKNGEIVTVHVPFSTSDFQKVFRVARAISIEQASGFDKMTEFFINNLLSGPETNWVNVVGNFISTAIHFLPQRFLETMTNMAVRDEKSAQIGEWKYIVRGLLPGLRDALKNAILAFSSEADPTGHRYLDDPMEIEFNRHGDIAKIAGYRGPSISGQKGKVIRIPGRLLRAMDAAFKSVIAHLEVGAQAYRLGKAQSLKGQDLADFIKAEINTSGSPSWHLAMGIATELTFQNDSWLTESVKQFTQIDDHKIEHHLKEAEKAEAKGDSAKARQHRAVANALSFTSGALKYLFPFVKTPTNILAVGLRKSPLGSGLLAYQIVKALGSGFVNYANGKPFAQDANKALLIKLFAEQVQAWAAFGMLFSAAEGDDDDDKKTFLIVGGRPPLDAASKEQQYRDYGGSYLIVIRGRDGKDLARIPFGRLEPIATSLGTTIDTIRRFKEMTRRSRNGEEGGNVSVVSKAIMKDFVAQASDKSFLKGFSDLMRSVDSIMRSEDFTSSALDGLKKAVLTAIVPNIVRQPMRNLDDKVRDPDKKEWWHDAFPMGSGSEPMIETFGRDVEKQELFPGSRLLLRAANKQLDKHPIEALWRAWNNRNLNNQIAPTGLRKQDYYVFRGKDKIALVNPDEKSRLERMIGAEFSRRMDNMAKNLDASKLPEDFDDMVTNAMSESRRLARKNFFQTPFSELKSAIP